MKIGNKLSILLLLGLILLALSQFLNKDLTSSLGWKTYTNDKYGFSFKYPSSANIKTEYNPSYPAGVADVENISFMVNNQGYEVSTFIDSMKNCHGAGNISKKCEDIKDWIVTSYTVPNHISAYDQIMIGNKIGYKQKGKTFACVAKEDNAYCLIAFKPYVGPLETEDSTYDNFLQSFKFAY